MLPLENYLKIMKNIYTLMEKHLHGVSGIVFTLFLTYLTRGNRVNDQMKMRNEYFHRFCE